MMFHN